MQIAYGPPGHKGVTHLMAVGADDLTPSPIERTVKVAGGVSLAVLLLGALTGKPRLVHMGLGGAAVAGVTCYTIRRTRRLVVA